LFRTTAVIVEDSDLGAPGWLTELKELGAVKWIANGVRKGQVYAILSIRPHAGLTRRICVISMV
jgi:hypothetical protein